MVAKFKKVNLNVNFVDLENSILKFWAEHKCFEKLVQKNKSKPRWSFLDGPMTANNPMGVHHAWGRTLKDTYQRYHAMIGHELRYQNGYDCQGLWVEVEVEKELGLKCKSEIETLVKGDKFKSIDYFVNLCKERVDKFAKIITNQSIRLGYWMNWDTQEDWLKPVDQRRSYYTNSEINNYAIWSFLKKCHSQNLIYKAYDAMPWCPRCGVGISQMEMHEGYKYVAHKAVFVKFPLEGKDKENLLVWTTTPWTLSSNVGAAVNPNLKYLKIKHKDEFFYVSEGAFNAQRLEEDFKKRNWIKGVPKLKSVAQIFKEKGGYEIVGAIKGSEMIGWRYRGPFDEFVAQNHKYGYPLEIAKVVEQQGWSRALTAKEAHKIILWEDVGETEGTGIVHIAPGCGKEDFGLGKSNDLPPIAPLDENGLFIEGFGDLVGKAAYEEQTTDFVLKLLKEKNIFIAEELYPHNYPHCWRCKTPLLFRLVDEWYISMIWRDKIMKVCHDIKWIPEFGLSRELDWLKNMGDWMISKKRYWGLALPIWVCESCGQFDVIGSKEELKSRAIEGWDKFEGHTPHKPWIDLVKIKCKDCGSVASRIQDVGNPWLDAGIVPYSTMGYFDNKEEWSRWFPADFITECFPGQFRNWFYALLAMSTMLEEKAPFKVLLGHALVLDEKGEEMHKSKGNAIYFDEAVQKIGADLMRWMFLRHNPANNINFGYGPAEEIRNKFILKLWNVYGFLVNYAILDNFDPHLPQIPVHERPQIDRWIISDLQLLIQTAHESFKNYTLPIFCQQIEDFVDNKLSNWYIRRNRRRFWKSEQSQDKLCAYQTLYEVLSTLIRLIAPFTPFLAEEIYQNLKAKDENDVISVHFLDYPQVNHELIDIQLNKEMTALLRIVSLGMAARQSAKIKVRQPLKTLKVQSFLASSLDQIVVEKFVDQICEELNVKNVEYVAMDTKRLVNYKVKPNFKALNTKFKEEMAVIVKFIQNLNADESSDLVTHLRNSGIYKVMIQGKELSLMMEDVLIENVALEGYAIASDKLGVVAIDTEINEELRLEGIIRDIVRYTQNLRKEADLNIEDRIKLALITQSKLVKNAISKHTDYLKTETLTKELVFENIANVNISQTINIGLDKITIQIKKL